MTHFILDQSAAAEYRADLIVKAVEYNLDRPKKINFKVRYYRSLGNLGARLESLGGKIQSRYSCLAMQEKRELLANSAK